MSSIAQAMVTPGVVFGGERSQKVLITFNVLLVLLLPLSLSFFLLKYVKF